MEAGFSRAVAEELYSKCDQDRDGSLTAWRFDGFESSAAFVQKFAQFLVLFYLGEVTNQDIGWLVSDNLATLDQVTPSSTVELCEVFMGSGMKWHEFNRTHTCVM